MTDGSPRTSPRRRGLWWKLLLVALVLVASLVALGHAIWRGKERAAVAQRLAAIRALGEPAGADDLIGPPIDEATNLVPLVREAIAARVTDEDRQARRRQMDGDDDHAFELPLTEAERDVLRGQTRDNARAIALLGGATTRPGVRWEAGPMAGSDPDFGAVRDLANLLGDAVTLASDEGQPADALAALHELPPLARAMGGKGSLIGYLVGIRIDGLRTQRAIDLAPTFAVEAANRKAVEALIADLLDEKPTREAARLGFLGERVAMHETMMAMANGTLAPAAVNVSGPGTAGPLGAATRYVVSPVLYASDAAILDYLAESLRLIDAKDRAEFNARATTLRAIATRVQSSKTEVMAAVLLSSLDRSFMIQFQAITDRRLAATALAIRMYQADHANTRPAELQALVPTYLQAVPLDAIDGKPLRYDAKRAIVWSVGENWKDDGGDATPTRARYTGRWQTPDAVVFLDRKQRPTTQATTGPTM